MIGFHIYFIVPRSKTYVYQCAPRFGKQNRSKQMDVSCFRWNFILIRTFGTNIYCTTLHNRLRQLIRRIYTGIIETIFMNHTYRGNIYIMSQSLGITWYCSFLPFSFCNQLLHNFYVTQNNRVLDRSNKYATSLLTSYLRLCSRVRVGNPHLLHGKQSDRLVHD